MLEVVFTKGRIGVEAVRIFVCGEKSRLELDFLHQNEKEAVLKACRQSKFEGKNGQFVEVLGGKSKIILAGIGKNPGEIEWQKLGGSLAKNVYAGDIMTKEVMQFNDRTPISEIAEMMEQQHHHAYPVVDKKGRLEGIITKSDIEDAFGAFGREKTIYAGQILDTNPVMVRPDEDLYTAYYRLHENTTEWAFVTDEDRRILGILTRKDILK